MASTSQLKLTLDTLRWVKTLAWVVDKMFFVNCISEAGMMDKAFLLDTVSKVHDHVQLISMVKTINEMAGFSLVDVTMGGSH